MKVVKQFGLARMIHFEGDVKAIDTFTRIHQALSERGYGIDLPEVDKTEEYEVPHVGKVWVERDDENHCLVTREVGFWRGGLA